MQGKDFRRILFIVIIEAAPISGNNTFSTDLYSHETLISLFKPCLFFQAFVCREGRLDLFSVFIYRVNTITTSFFFATFFFVSVVEKWIT
jgi:hypothetical protein